MPEYIVRVNEDNTISLPTEVRDRMILEPGDKMVIRFDQTEEHMILGKLPMDAMEKATEINNFPGQKIKISE